jgi:molecular chaperone HtpG
MYNFKKHTTMQKGHIGVTSKDLFPIIKKYLYSEHDIFLREIISNAIDATQKLKTLASVGEFKDELGDVTIQVKLDKDKKTITVSDRGIGMTEDEVNRYINQIAFSSAEEFLEKYKDKASAIIGHFGLGFYSSFMVSERVEIVTKSYKPNSVAVNWSCTGTPEFSLEETTKDERGTDIILHIAEDSIEYLEEFKIEELLKKYCKFLPIEIGFGKEKEWKDGKQVETDKNKIINNPKPAWTKKPADLKEEDYQKFYRELYPYGEEPLFNIHLNVDHPFTLTGILYFPRLKNNFEIQKNKIQLYCNQVFVTDSVEGIVPEYLTLLHGVIDSPDIPLNVSRSYLQTDSNVKKISSHISKKVSDSLHEIFKKDRAEFEKKWEDLKLFMQYGMISDEKFYERAEKFFLLKNTDGKYFTFEEYNAIIKENQTDKNKKVVYIYTNDVDGQYSYISAAKAKGLDVLLMESQLDPHFINNVEQKLKDARFVRVDSEVVDKLVPKEDTKEVKLAIQDQGDLTTIFRSQLTGKDHYFVMFENLSETGNPVVITQSEFMRRMKDMSALGGNAGMYGKIPDSYNLVLNVNHPLIDKILKDKEEKAGAQLNNINNEMKPLKDEKVRLKALHEGKEEDKIPETESDMLEELDKRLDEMQARKDELLTNYGKENKIVKQLVDIALLANNMLKGEDLSKFVNRSIELIK